MPLESTPFITEPPSCPPHTSIFNSPSQSASSITRSQPCDENTSLSKHSLESNFIMINLLDFGHKSAVSSQQSHLCDDDDDNIYNLTDISSLLQELIRIAFIPRFFVANAVDYATIRLLGSLTCLPLSIFISSSSVLSFLTPEPYFYFLVKNKLRKTHRGSL